MGCATCISGAHVQSPETITLPRSYYIRSEREFAKLKPCHLMSQQQLNQRKIICENFDIFNKQTPLQTTNAHLKSASSNRNIVNWWKMLVLCSGCDFFEEQWQTLEKDRHHNSFKTVGLDLRRTFSTCECLHESDNSQALQGVLKMLAVYFPTIGYTQGLNYLAGYLIIVGFTEKECFWFLVHLALQQKYMILGLFEDHFPLVTLYCVLFKHLFASKLPKLFAQFTLLGVTDDLWIFKWFLTFYLSSLPITVIKPIWDFIFVVGSIGLVYLAIGLLIHLEKKIHAFEDSIDVSEFFDSLKEEPAFSKLVKISKWIEISSEIELSTEQISRIIDQSDLDGQTKINKHTFYNRFNSQTDPQIRKKLYSDWLKSVQSQRTDFWSQTPELVESSRGPAFMNLRRKLKKARISNISERINRVRVNSSSHVQTYFQRPSGVDEQQILEFEQPVLEPNYENKASKVVLYSQSECSPSPRKSENIESLDRINYEQEFQRDFIAQFDSVESVQNQEGSRTKKQQSYTTQDIHTKKDLDVFNLE